jgi:hypothetical protein
MPPPPVYRPQQSAAQRAQAPACPDTRLIAQALLRPGAIQRASSAPSGVMAAWSGHMAAGRRSEAIEALRDGYGIGSAREYTLRAVSRGSASRHAATSGGYKNGRHGGPISISVGTEYMDRVYNAGAPDPADFNKLAHTLQHEHVHVGQRRSASVMAATTKYEREFLAYSTEVLDRSLPPLTGRHLTKTIAKARHNYDRMPPDKQLAHLARMRNVDAAAPSASSVSVSPAPPRASMSSISAPLLAPAAPDPAPRSCLSWLTCGLFG